jgi:hypothetical protein
MNPKAGRPLLTCPIDAFALSHGNFAGSPFSHRSLLKRTSVLRLASFLMVNNRISSEGFVSRSHSVKLEDCATTRVGPLPAPNVLFS